MLRCVQLGIRIQDLDLLDEGMIIDMMIEAGNDGYKYHNMATQEDMDRF